MPLRKTSALDEWAWRDNPRFREWRLIERWVHGLDDRPWAYPSIELTLASGSSTEIREATVPGTDVVVTYEHEHATGIVDLLKVERRPEPD